MLPGSKRLIIVRVENTPAPLVGWSARLVAGGLFAQSARISVTNVTSAYSVKKSRFGRHITESSLAAPPKCHI
jgi:hypothetical protein